MESIPIGLYPSFPPPERSIADSWLHLLNKANSSVHIAAFYFTLREGDLDSSDSQVSSLSRDAAYDVIIPVACFTCF